MFIVHSTLRDATSPYTERYMLYLMKKIIFILNFTLILSNIACVYGQNDAEKINQIISELEKEGGEFNQNDYESTTIELSEKLFSVSSECIKVDIKNLERQDLFENKKKYIWICRDVKANQMYLIIADKKFEEISCNKQTFREVYLTNKVLNKW